MKKTLFLFLCLTALVLSCKKNGPSAPAVDATQYYVSAIRTYNPQALFIDSFTYSSDHLLSRYVQYTFDSSGSSPTADSTIYAFTFSAGAKVPSSYTIFSDGVTLGGHQLYYDGQNRIIKDSNLNGSLYVTTYTYPGSTLASNEGYYFFGSVYRKDTLLFTNGNLTSEQIYSPNSTGTADTLDGTLKFTYSSYGNPVYHPEIGGTIGHLLFNIVYDGTNNYGDFVSKDFAKTVMEVQPGLPSVSASYNSTLDSKGRISQVTTSIYPASYFRVVFSYY